jgi:hypothetical protein
MSVDDVSRRRAEIIRRAANALIDLVGPDFPKPISRSAPAYRVAQHGLVAKATSLMEGIVDALEANRRSNLQILIRSLCDHATILAWLAADPERNYPLWKSEDARARVKAHNEWKRDLGADLLAPQILAELEAVAAETHAGPTDLAARARAADEYWKPRLGLEEEPLAGFVATYQVLFRSGSTRMHPSLQGLNDVTELTPDHVVVKLEQTHQDPAIAGTAVLIYALALRVSAQINGFPRPEDVNAIVAQYMREKAELDREL